MDKIEVKKLLIEDKCIKVVFDTSDSLKQYFKSNAFEINYSVSIENVPYSIAVIPFVCNVLPIVWMTNAELIVDTLDADFLRCIDEVKNGFSQIHEIELNGKLSCKTEENTIHSTRSMAFFSGGVDAVATVLAHIDEKPSLFTIWGADVKYDDVPAWQNIDSQVQGVCKTLDLDSISCRTNFRAFIDEDSCSLLMRQCGTEPQWWLGFQSGIGLIGHAAPVAYKYGYKNIYIGSSYTMATRGQVRDASDPRTDGKMAFCGAQVYHDQFEFNRQQKLQHIVEFVNRTNIKIPLRVCWQSWSGKNCCHCEKCYRTICGLVAEGANPNDYGFPMTNHDIQRMQFELRNVYHLSTMQQIFWKEIKERINTNTALEIPRQYRWLTNFSIVNSFAPKSIFSKFCRFITRRDNIANRVIIAFINIVRGGGIIIGVCDEEDKMFINNDSFKYYHTIL